MNAILVHALMVGMAVMIVSLSYSLATTWHDIATLSDRVRELEMLPMIPEADCVPTPGDVKVPPAVPEWPI